MQKKAPCPGRRGDNFLLCTLSILANHLVWLDVLTHIKISIHLLYHIRKLNKVSCMYDVLNLSGEVPTETVINELCRSWFGSAKLFLLPVLGCWPILQPTHNSRGPKEAWLDTRTASEEPCSMHCGEHLTEKQWSHWIWSRQVSKSLLVGSWIQCHPWLRMGEDI